MGRGEGREEEAILPTQLRVHKEGFLPNPMKEAMERRGRERKAISGILWREAST